MLHDSFGFDFPTIAEIVGRTPVAARKPTSRARTTVAQPTTRSTTLERQADWQVVDALLAAARNGDFARLVKLLAPNVLVEGDHAAIPLGAPERIEGAEQVAQFFNGAAKAAFPVYVANLPGAAWIHRGEPKVVFDFSINQGMVQRIDLRVEPRILSRVQRRQGQRRA